ncbi:MAG: 3'-5' exonuclease [Flavihumibacter sp.]
MEFRIADTFTASLGRLTGDEQKAVKTTAFDLQMNPDNPGLRYHKLDKAKDRNFWSVSANMDIRLIVHKTGDSLLLCYVDHHAKAYAWAERRKLEVHPKTGAAQLIEIRETVQEIRVPVYIEETKKVPAKALFDAVTADELLSYGVPEQWLADVQAATEETLLLLADHLPAEAAEALLELATGGKPVMREQAAAMADPFDHPDAKRRFRVLRNQDELERALDYPWDKWSIFLHPEQQALVEKVFNGPAKVSGSAGTGKTIVALHRAVHLARRNDDNRVLLTTFSPILANALKIKLRRLIAHEPLLAERIEIYPIQAIAIRLYTAHFGKPLVADKTMVRKLMSDLLQEVGPANFSEAFLLSEWWEIVDAWQINDWVAYRDAPRLGRKTRLNENHRLQLWKIFEQVNQRLAAENKKTIAGIFSALAEKMQLLHNKPFSHVVVDEAQDISISQLKWLAALTSPQPEGLFFAGDTGQRIFQLPFSWKSAGVELRGRSKTLQVNYRTSHQIREQADRLLEPMLQDADGNTEQRNHTVSVFNGPDPVIHRFDKEDDEITSVAAWLADKQKQGIALHEIGVFVRSDAEMPRILGVMDILKVPFVVLDEKVEAISGSLAVSTMHYAKGLEFKVVVVVACDDDVIPLQERIESIADHADLQETYRTERHLLYVACTRAR